MGDGGASSVSVSFEVRYVASFCRAIATPLWLILLLQHSVVTMKGDRIETVVASTSLILQSDGTRRAQQQALEACNVKLSREHFSFCLFGVSVGVVAYIEVDVLVVVVRLLFY